ncbi:hypothetical protein ACFL4J_01265 [Candidatus Margulisiibacteriota bacterium]
MRAYAILPYTYGSGTAKGNLIKLANHARAIERVMQRHNIKGGTILVNSSAPEYYNLSTAAAKTSSSLVEDIPGMPGIENVGYNRFLGLKHAFEIKKADVAVVQNADGHHRPEAIPEFAMQLTQRSADLAVGVRPSFVELGELLLKAQLGPEVTASRMIAMEFGLRDIQMETDGTHDLLSGCSAFSRQGWNNFLTRVRPYLPEGDILGMPAQFDLGVPALFHSFGLRVIPVKIEVRSRIDHLPAEEVDRMNGDPKLWAQRKGVIQDATAVIDLVNAAIASARAAGAIS